MVKIYVTKTCACPVKGTVIKSRLQSFLEKNGVNDGEISVAIVGKAKMITLAKKYLKEKNTVHNVLSFTDSEVSHRFVRPPGVTFLGEIVICYPKVIEEANLLDKRVDDRVVELAEHEGLIYSVSTTNETELCITNYELCTTKSCIEIHGIHNT